MKFNQELIQKLRNGEVAINKGQNIELVKAVLKEAFPKDRDTMHLEDFYFEDRKIAKDLSCRKNWIWIAIHENQYNLPTHSIEDFIEVEPKDQKQYMVIIQGKFAPKMIHTTFESAEKEAKRLLTQELNDTRLDEIKATIVSVEKVLTATKKITIS